MSNREKKLLNFLFRLRGYLYAQCLEPTRTCNRKAIKAHSIQNSIILEQLVENGHLIALMNGSGPTQWPRSEFTRIGRKQYPAIFYGLCGKHDDQIFAPIEKRSLDIQNREHLFLIAYRSILREMWAHHDEVATVKRAYDGALETGNNDVEQIVRAKSILDFFEKAKADFDSQKQMYDQIYIAEDYQAIVHRSFLFEKQLPTIAASTGMTWSLNEKPDDKKYLVINVFPFEGNLYVIFSFRNYDADFFNPELDNYDELDMRHQLLELSSWLLNCDSFVINPIHFQSWSVEKKRSIKEFRDGNMYAHPMLDNIQLNFPQQEALIDDSIYLF